MSCDSGQFIAAAAGSLRATGIDELRDAVRHCPCGSEGVAVCPQAHAEQMIAAGKLGSAILTIQVSIYAHMAPS
jgi:hypothetical protein